MPYRNDSHVLRMQHFAQLIAHQVDDALEIQRSGHPLLDAVDDRELGVALLGLLQQPLRLAEQPRTLQRHAHAGRHRAEQPDFRRAERVLALEVLDVDRAEHPIVAQDRHANHAKRLVGARHYRQAPRAHLGGAV